MPTPTDRFEPLTTLLAEWYPIWSVEPFQYLEPPWAALQPGLAARLRKPRGPRRHAGHGEGQFDADRAAIRAWLPADRLGRLIQLPRLPTIHQPPHGRLGLHVGGRKWLQIAAFAARARINPGQAVVEWCAGKAHLSRALAHCRRTPVTALECDARLCHQGEALARRQGLAVSMQRQNVMDPDVLRWLHPRVHVVALHACGDLHQRLIQLATETGSTITLAPCCYQRTVHERYAPLSETGRGFAQNHALSLTRQDLALAVQETVTAPGHAQRQRLRAKAWRLGFDLIQRELRGVDSYLPVPRLRNGSLPHNFEDFCRWAAAEKRLSLPVSLDWNARERDGWNRLEEVERLEQVRHFFRRPLEIWLALDRARRLEETGMRVELGTFCDRDVTPRNLLLQASAG